jgi:hypothetical protein
VFLQLLGRHTDLTSEESYSKRTKNPGKSWELGNFLLRASLPMCPQTSEPDIRGILGHPRSPSCPRQVPELS